MRRGSMLKMAVAAVVLAIAALLPVFQGGYLLFQLELVLLYIAAGTGLNVAVGYSGEFLLSQATVIGVAAYTAGVLSYSYGWSVWATLPAAVVAAVVWQVLISIAGVRVRGLYLGLLTFFSVLVFPDLVLIAKGVTQGSLGLIGVPPLVPQGYVYTAGLQYEITVAIAAVSALLVALLVWSGWGIRMRYLRDAPNALSTAGISVVSTKVVVYVISAIPAGLAGWAYPFINRSITSSVFDLSLTLVIFAGVEIVGPGTIWGPIVGVALLEGYSQLVGPFSQYNVIGLGLLLAVSLILFPDGLQRGLRPVMARLLPRRRRASAPSDAGTLLAEHEQATAATAHAPVKLPPTGHVDAPPTLSVSGLSKSFGGVHAVRDVTFTASSGRVMAIMGENGSGKTTLINLITGFLSADSGEVRLGDRQVTGLRPAQIARLGCTRTFQVPQLVGELSVMENVQSGLLHRMCGSPWRAILLPWTSRRIDRRRRDRATEVCRELGFTDVELDASAEILPLGLRRLAEVARAAATDAQVVFLDEPAAGLNEQELVNLSQSIRAFAAAGRTILVVEHNAQFVLDTCDDVLLMRAGRVHDVFRAIDPGALPLELQRHLRRTTPVGELR